MMRSELVTFLATSTLTFSGLAGTLWVDGSLDNYAGHDGSSRAKALETIQEAVDAAQEGDTILVAPGVYAKGGRVDSVDKTISNRVTIAKSLTLKSLKGASSTVIKGEFDTSSATKCGAASMRCIGITSDKAEVVIEGFTMTGGSTLHSSNSRYSWGAGVCGYARSVSPVFVVDCIVSNNWGSRGVGVYGCTSVRTLFCNNHAQGAGASIRSGNAANCIFNEPDTPSGGRAAIDSMYHVVNCTFAVCKNPINSMQSNDPVYCNCIVAACDATVTVDKEPGATLHDFVTEGTFYGPRICADSTDWSDNAAPSLVAPILGDFRPIAGGPADGTGKATHLEQDFLPERYRTTDFFGKPRMTDGTICLGAIEGAVIVKSGRAYFPFTTRCESTVNGYVMPTNLPNRAMYAYASEWPTQWRLDLVPYFDNVVFGVQQKDAWSVMRFPDRKGGMWLSPSPVGTILTNGVVFAGLVRWVSQETGDDDYTGADLGSEAHPYATIQKAVIAATNKANGAVFVKAGVYDTGRTFEQNGYNRVTIGRGLRLVAVDGPEKTFIVGAKDTGAGATEGCGPDAIRCIGVKGGVQAGICGFTLTGGYSPVNASYGGGALMAANTPDVQLIGCVVTNNYGSRGAATFGGWSIACYFSKNTNVAGGNAISRNGLSSGCVFYSNGSRSNYAGYLQRCYNCTFIAGGKTVNDVDTELYNCIVRTAACVNNAREESHLSGNVFYNVTTLNPTSGYLLEDPLLLDANKGDTRLYPTSPAIGVGTVDVPNFAQFLAGGFDGEGILFKDGKPTAGARQKPVVAVQVVARASGEIEPSGKKYLDPGASLTVTAKGSDKRQFLGFWADGEFVDTAGVKTFTYAVPDVYRIEPIELSAAYATNWYVNADATIGDDENDGWTPETARRTLAAAVRDAAPGDVVHAAAGVYDDGDAIQSSPYVQAGDTCPDIRARVVVPNGVTLEGEDRETTVIEGRLGANAGGCGTNALRCVYLEQNAVLRRFTLRKGRTAPREAPNYADDNYMGGGVRGAKWNTTLVENCLITNCCAPRGGGLLYTRARNCRIVGNTSQANGGAARNCGLYGCYVGANTGSSPTIVNEEFVNSVYAADNSANFGDWDGNGPSRVINSILYSCVSGNHYAPKSMTNVVLIGSAKMETEGAFGTQKYATDEPLKLDADGRPTADSPLVDAGDAALVDWTADLDGGQRIYNGAVDIGCWEYDWREAFAAALGGPGLTVTAASAGVKLADGTVTLGDGDTLAGTWATGSATAVTRYAASASATDGTLAGGFVCEEPAFEKDLVATDGSASAAFKLKNAPLDFAFTFDGTGSGRLYGFDRQVRGMTLLVR